MRKISKGKNHVLSQVVRREKNYISLPNILPLLLTGNQLKVICYLLLIPDDDNPPQTEIAPMLGLSTKTVSQVLKELVDLGILSKIKAPTRHTIYQINPLEYWNLEELVNRHAEVGLSQVEKNPSLFLQLQQ